jgi:hypothetical protein
MQIPIIHDLQAGTTSDHLGAPTEIPPGMVLSTESQLKLRSLCQYVDFCRQMLDQIQQDLLLYESSPDGSVHLQRASERLGRLCVEADSWGFNAPYEISFGLQMLLLNSGGRVQSNGFWEALQRGLGMLSALLEQCERDFRWRLATADTLDCIAAAAGN